MALAGTHIEVNGLRIYYEVHGEGQPLVLVHGGTATSQSWASHLPAFTEHFQVYHPRQPRSWQDRQPDGRTRLPRDG